MTLTPAEARSRVAKGASKADAQWPGWEQTLNRDTFKIASCTSCVLAQTAGSFIGGLHELWPVATYPSCESEAHGFSLDGRGATDAEVEAGWAMLQTAWEELHDARLSQPALAVPNLAELLGVA